MTQTTNFTSGTVVTSDWLNAVDSHVFDEYISVKQYGAVGDGVTDDTAAIQAAIDAAWVTHALLIFPTGNYLVTDTLNVYEGTQIKGDTRFPYPAGFGVDPKATSIFFAPTASGTDLFYYSWRGTSPPGFVFHTSIEGLYFETATANARYGINLNKVIYSQFSSMGFEGPWTASIYCDGTINNRFESVYAVGEYSAVVYAGNTETTDVWDQCSFWGSPVGVRFEGASVGVRFNSCLWEQIDYFGIDIHSQCQSIIVSDAYCEDVPYNTDASSCMFRVGLHTGSSTAHISNHLIVHGGVFNGRNAGASGQLFNIGVCWGIIVSGIVANRWPVLFSTTADTANNSIVVSGIQGISWTTTIDDTSKWTGTIPNGVLNSGTFDQNLLADAATFTSTQTTTLTNSQIIPGAAWYPDTDGVANLGSGSKRWGTLYASTGTINTSDSRDKQDIDELNAAEKRVAVSLKNLVRKYKFKDSVQLKGDAARIHIGVMAQDVVEAFKAEGLDARRYGLLCYDEWEAEVDKKGKEKRTAGGRYGIRYEELLAFIITTL